MSDTVAGLQGPRRPADRSPVLTMEQPQPHCLWCRKSDDTDEYDGQMLLTCDSCLAKSIHIACDAVRRGAPPLSKEHVMSDQPWFCSTDCEQVRCAQTQRLFERRPELSKAAVPRCPFYAALHLCP